MKEEINEKNECCEIGPGRVIRTHDMIHCADCGRNILPSIPSYTDLIIEVEKLKKEIRLYQATIADLNNRNEREIKQVDFNVDLKNSVQYENSKLRSRIEELEYKLERIKCIL